VAAAPELFGHTPQAARRPGRAADLCGCGERRGFLNRYRRSNFEFIGSGSITRLSAGASRRLGCPDRVVAGLGRHLLGRRSSRDSGRRDGLLHGDDPMLAPRLQVRPGGLDLPQAQARDALGGAEVSALRACYKGRRSSWCHGTASCPMRSSRAWTRAGFSMKWGADQALRFPSAGDHLDDGETAVVPHHQGRERLLGLFYRPILDRFGRARWASRPSTSANTWRSIRPRRKWRCIPGLGTRTHWGGDFTQWTGRSCRRRGGMKCGAPASITAGEAGFDQRQAALANPEEVRHLIVRAFDHLLVAETSCNFYWGSRWVHRSFDELEQAITCWIWP